MASRAPEEQQREFLSSTDPWFRPVQFTTGWDGNLYIVDIYRKLVEDPESIPEPIKRDLDFYAGTDRGRIYRVVPAMEPGPAPRKPALKGTDPQSLVRLLSHPNRWWRLTAQRLLVQHQEMSVVAGLKDVVRRGESAKGRLHALNTLEGLSAVDSEILAPALRGLESRGPGTCRPDGRGVFPSWFRDSSAWRRERSRGSDSNWP